MLNSFTKLDLGPLPEGRHRNSPHSTPEADRGDGRLAQLRDQEQLWFSWLTVLHGRLNKVTPGEGIAVDALKVLEIAKRRWLEAREALRQHQSDD